MIKTTSVFFTNKFDFFYVCNILFFTETIYTGIYYLMFKIFRFQMLCSMQDALYDFHIKQSCLDQQTAISTKKSFRFEY